MILVMNQDLSILPVIHENFWFYFSIGAACERNYKLRPFVLIFYGISVKQAGSRQYMRWQMQWSRGAGVRWWACRHSAFGPRTGDEAQGPGSGRAGMDPRAGARTGVKTHVLGGEGADVGRGKGAEPLMISTAAEINHVITDPVGGEAARLEVGELTVTGTSGKSS